MRWTHPSRPHASSPAMRVQTRAVRLPLGGRLYVALEHARAVRVTAIEGAIWVTIYGDRRDIVLNVGESFVVPSDDKVLAVALGGRAIVKLEGSAGRVRHVETPSGPESRRERPA